MVNYLKKKIVQEISDKYEKEMKTAETAELKNQLYEKKVVA